MAALHFKTLYVATDSAVTAVNGLVFLFVWDKHNCLNLIIDYNLTITLEPSLPSRY